MSSNILVAELGYLDGVTSNIQTQLNNLEPSIAVIANRALVSDTSGGLIESSVTDIELSYLSGVSSNVQTQFGCKTTKSN